MSTSFWRLPILLRLFLSWTLTVTLFSCTQDNTFQSPQATNEVGHVSPDMPAVRAANEQSAAHRLQSDSSKDRPQLSDITSMQADANGDKIPDLIELCHQTKVCITRGRTNEQTVYSDQLWNGVRIIDVQDTDGKDGDDVILHITKEDGSLACICVIHDASGTIVAYRDTEWQATRVHSVVDTDGQAGKEIVLLVSNTAARTQFISVIHDQKGSYHNYEEWDWSILSGIWAADTDGKPGLELVLEVRNGDDQLQCICVIHDGVEAHKVYAQPSWINGHVILLIDTDGRGGADIIVAYQTSLTSGIDVIHDSGAPIREYTFRGAIPSIQHISQGTKGQDICVLLQEENQLFLLTEREDTPITVSTCGSKA